MSNIIERIDSNLDSAIEFIEQKTNERESKLDKAINDYREIRFAIIGGCILIGVALVIFVLPLIL